MKTNLTIGVIGLATLALVACGPSETEIQEEKEAAFRGKIVVSCLDSMNKGGSSFEPAVAGELCNCAASEVVKEMGVAEGSDGKVPGDVMSKVVKTCLAKVNPPAPGS